MTPQRYERIREIFIAACKLPPEDRARYVAETCGDDRELRREVESLLASHQDSGEFLETPVLGSGFELPGPELVASGDSGVRVEVADQRLTPKCIGSYEIVRVLGEGGMGVVYEARQDRPKRSVALKVIRPGVASRTKLRSIELEAQVLGRLQHPGIAQIYEAGTADAGYGPQPFFAMELVKGRSLLEHAEAEDLSTRRRLELVVQICDAVQHAHQKSVIHRDLKPANILVDERGRPKILDFGVARATDPDVHASTVRSGAGQLVGTLAYMSPEQVGGAAHEVDTRSDVYALGVICYELLAGRLPHDVQDKTIAQTARLITDEDPTPISSIKSSCRGDIETIVSKALEKDKGRRYQSPYDLGADLGRYLRDEPIAARPPSTIYSLRKFARRNRGLVGGVTRGWLGLER